VFLCALQAGGDGPIGITSSYQVVEGFDFLAPSAPCRVNWTNQNGTVHKMFYFGCKPDGQPGVTADFGSSNAAAAAAASSSPQGGPAAVGVKGSSSVKGAPAWDMTS
jgi:hypothetical protein